jgi:hypothetical protein
MRERLGDLESLHLSWLAAYQATVASHLPEAVYVAEDIFVNRHGLTFRLRRRFQSCAGGRRIDLLAPVAVSADVYQRTTRLRLADGDGGRRNREHPRRPALTGGAFS